MTLSNKTIYTDVDETPGAQKRNHNEDLENLN